MLLTLTLALVSTQNLLQSSSVAAILTNTDIDNPNALRRYYDLLLSVIRVIVSAVFSRGVHNEQIKAQTRAFIAENRPCMVGVFKRFAKIGGDAAADHQDALRELVKSFMALVTATDFLEVRFPAVHAKGAESLISI